MGYTNPMTPTYTQLKERRSRCKGCRNLIDFNRKCSLILFRVGNYKQTRIAFINVCPAVPTLLELGDE